jgi:hypothetical protein
MEYLPALGDAWIQAGGVWHDSDPIHFEYPGFTVPKEKNIIARVMDWYGSLPWYVTVLLPTEFSVSERKVTYEKLRELASDVGVNLP